MSGIAEIMHNLGYKVQGSDVSDSANVKRLRGMGIAIAIGHAAGNLKDAHAVVYSSAVKPGNVEFDAARALTPKMVSLRPIDRDTVDWLLSRPSP